MPGPGAPVAGGRARRRYGSRTPPASTATVAPRPREMVEGGPIDVLTGDYLAELTMLILWKARQKDPAAGFARRSWASSRTVLGTCLDQGIKIVNNAGGLNPACLAARAGRAGRTARPAPEDRLRDRRRPAAPAGRADRGRAPAGPPGHRPAPGPGAGKPVTANAYLGGWGITAALDAGRGHRGLPRVTDASLVTGPAAWWHGWAPRRLRRAGRCGAGRPMSSSAARRPPGATTRSWREIQDRRYPGFPIAEVRGRRQQRDHQARRAPAAWSRWARSPPSRCTRSPNRPTPTPTSIAHFDTVTLDPDGPDRVRAGRHERQPAAAHGPRWR